MGFERIVPGTYEWDAFYGNHVARYQFAVERLRDHRPMKILDAACGVGYGTKFLADSLATSIIGVDRSSEALEIAKSRFSGVSVTFLQDDCHTLLEASKHSPFDAVVSMETFEHLPRPTEFLAAIRRVLRPNGILVISTPNAGESAKPADWQFHEMEYSADKFSEMLVDAGFQDVRLFGQQLTERGRDRADMRSELTRLRQNPFVRFGSLLQRALRGRQTEFVMLPERPDDYHFTPFKTPEDLRNARECDVQIGVARR